MKLEQKIRTDSLKKMRLNMSSAKWRTFCLGLNVLKGAESDVNSLKTTGDMVGS